MSKTVPTLLNGHTVAFGTVQIAVCRAVLHAATVFSEIIARDPTMPVKKHTAVLGSVHNVVCREVLHAVTMQTSEIIAQATMMGRMIESVVNLVPSQ